MCHDVIVLLNTMSYLMDMINTLKFSVPFYHSLLYFLEKNREDSCVILSESSILPLEVLPARPLSYEKNEHGLCPISYIFVKCVQ